MFYSFSNSTPPLHPGKQVFQGPHGCLLWKLKNNFSVIKIWVPCLTPSDLGGSHHSWSLSLSAPYCTSVISPMRVGKQWECPCLNILQVLQLSRIILPVRFHWNWHNPLPLTSHYIWWERKTISNILGKEIFFGAGQGGRDYDFPERLWLWIPASASLNSLSLLCILLLSFLFFADSPQIKKFILLCHSQQFGFLQPWLQTYLQIYFYIFKTNQQKAC